MSTFQVLIELDNAAFDPEPANELARVLELIAERLRERTDSPEGAGLVRDVNGNTVGRYGPAPL